VVFGEIEVEVKVKVKVELVVGGVMLILRRMYVLVIAKVYGPEAAVS